MSYYVGDVKGPAITEDEDAENLMRVFKNSVEFIKNPNNKIENLDVFKNNIEKAYNDHLKKYENVLGISIRKSGMLDDPLTKAKNEVLDALKTRQKVSHAGQMLLDIRENCIQVMNDIMKINLSLEKTKNKDALIKDKAKLLEKGSPKHVMLACGDYNRTRNT